MTKRRTLTVAGLSVAAAITGAALTAAALPAMAEGATPSPSSSSSSSESTTTTPSADDPSKGGHQANGVTEELLTGDAAAKATAAVQAKYPDATIQRVENDAEGDSYEAHILQADGSSATVKLDDSFTVTGLEAGGPGGGRHGDRQGDDDSTTSDSSSTTTS
ncbi:MAG: hypothetical protein JWR33_654 [Naasia sp.]|uniref:hypothetical protein n=1 Tax=Naasia sp. TaxID=2546198 RepID=UPI0026161BEE|nr:hypothetical protein [Naasia sp.]MCU1569913.1 hypothetical protein [Naasia sp.]